MPEMLLTLSGALAMAQAAIALFFLRFHRRTHDRLFLWFAIAFALLALQRLLLNAARDWTENAVWLYGLRLVAFVLILVAIVDKNRSAARGERR